MLDASASSNCRQWTFTDRTAGPYRISRMPFASTGRTSRTFSRKPAVARRPDRGTQHRERVQAHVLPDDAQISTRRASAIRGYVAGDSTGRLGQLATASRPTRPCFARRRYACAATPRRARQRRSRLDLRFRKQTTTPTRIRVRLQSGERSRRTPHRLRTTRWRTCRAALFRRPDPRPRSWRRSTAGCPRGGRSWPNLRGSPDPPEGSLDGFLAGRRDRDAAQADDKTVPRNGAPPLRPEAAARALHATGADRAGPVSAPVESVPRRDAPSRRPRSHSPSSRSTRRIRRRCTRAT